MADTELAPKSPQPISYPKPPVTAPLPDFKDAVAYWCYRDPQGDPLFYYSRHQRADGKVFYWHTWDEDKWAMKGYPAPRPLYGLELLSKSPNAPVLLVEGEKAADAARTLMGRLYVVMTWPGGANGVKNVDFTPLIGRKVLLWPDADDPGRTAMATVGERLAALYCPEIKVLDPFLEPDSKKDGWDAADALAAGWDEKQVIQWGKQRVKLVELPIPKVEVLAPTRKKQPHQVEDVTNQEPVSRSMAGKWLDVGISQSSKGIPIYNEDNVLRIFERDEFFEEFVWWDDFHKKYFTHWREIGMNSTIEEWTDIHLLRLTTHLQREWGLSKINYLQIQRAAETYAHQRIKNEPKDWVKSLEWDGKARIDECLSEAFGAPTNAYTYAVSKNFFLSLVARLFDPGCQADHMMILEGAQGIYKSSALRLLGGKWYSSCRANLANPNFYSNIQGKWIIEIAEMDSFRKMEITQVKEMLTTPVDRFKIPYARFSADFPRQCIFVGTTNEKEYLQDLSGARRFWPVTVSQIRLDWLLKNRDQLFAEAYKRYMDYVGWKNVQNQKAKRGEPTAHISEAPENWWMMPDEITKVEQDMRREVDPWEEPIRDYIRNFTVSGITIREILKELAFPMERQGKKEQIRIAKILRYMGWTKRDSRNSITGEVVKLWTPLEGN